MFQQFFRRADPDVFQVAVGRDPFRLGKRAQKRGAAQAGAAADLVQADAPGVILLHERAGLFDLVPAFGDALLKGLAVALEQQR